MTISGTFSSFSTSNTLQVNNNGNNNITMGASPNKFNNSILGSSLGGGGGGGSFNQSSNFLASNVNASVITEEFSFGYHPW